MTNAERIEVLRYCGADKGCLGCPLDGIALTDCFLQVMIDAADALEAAEKRIKELKSQAAFFDAEKLNYQENIEYRDERIKELEAQLPKEGEWIWENYYWHCSACGENPTRGMGYVQGKNELFRVCPNCGARMQTVTDCHTLRRTNDEQQT